uniref:Uncharacterized protein n=1 Tax=Anguilla anguilla TaxID=7936 RepID=A0A0E9TL98_ANGAN
MISFSDENVPFCLFVIPSPSRLTYMKIYKSFSISRSSYYTSAPFSITVLIGYLIVSSLASMKCVFKNLP